jgi:hypothetical protein
MSQSTTSLTLVNPVGGRVTLVTLPDREYGHGWWVQEHPWGGQYADGPLLWKQGVRMAAVYRCGVSFS